MLTFRLLCAAALIALVPVPAVAGTEPRPEPPTGPVHTVHPADLPADAEQPVANSPFVRRRPARTGDRTAMSTAPQPVTAYVPTLLVDFPDNAAETSVHPPSAYQSLLFEQGYAGGAGSLRDYYLAQSGGLLDVTGMTTPWLRMPRNYSAYVGSSYGYQMSTPNDWTLVEDAVGAADQHVDFCSADADRNGQVDNIFVVHAGPGAEETGSGLWSVQWRLPSPFTTADRCSDGRTMRVSTFTIQPEEYASTRFNAPGSPDRLIGVGMFAHEFGHVLGLPDLYDTDYSSPGGVGPWDVMASGAWGFSGSRPWRPTPLSAWSKARLGWATVTNVTQNSHGVELPSTDAPHTGPVTGIHRLAPQGSATTQEYFLIENRTREGWAADFPTGGLAIWHVHDGRSGNSQDDRRLVELVQADGNNDLSRGTYARGDSGDLFPGSRGLTALTTIGQPNTALQGGIDSLLEIRNIGTPGPTTRADLLLGPADEPPSPDQATWAADSIVIKRGRKLSGGVASVNERDGDVLTLASRRRPGTKVLDYYWVIEALGAPEGVTLEIATARRLRASMKAYVADEGWVNLGGLDIAAAERDSVTIPDTGRYVAGGRMLVRFTTHSDRQIRHEIDLVSVTGS